MAERPKFQINRTLLLRIAAVGLFVALGTFAVMHSMRGTPNEQTAKGSGEQSTQSGDDPAAAPDELPGGSLGDGGGITVGQVSSPGSAFKPISPAAEPAATNRGAKTGGSTDPPSFSQNNGSFSPGGDSPAIPNTRNRNRGASPGGQFPPRDNAGGGDFSASAPTGQGAFRSEANRSEPTVAPGLLAASPSGPEAPKPDSSTLPGLPGKNAVPTLSVGDQTVPDSTATIQPKPQPPAAPSIALPPSRAFADSPPNSSRSDDTLAPLRSNVQVSPGFQAEPPRNPASLAQPPSSGLGASLGQTTPATRPPTTVSLSPQPMVSALSTGNVNAGVATTQDIPGQKHLEGVQSPSLTLEKIAPREVQVDRPATFELIVRNTGQVAASQVIVHDQVPAGAQLIDATPQPQRAGNNQLAWELGTLKPGDTRSIKMQLLPKNPGEMGSVANVIFAAEASVRTVCTQPDLQLVHTGPKSVLVGEPVVLDITIENKGDGAAENVVIQEDVPDGLEFEGGLRELQYDVGTLKPGESRKLQLRLTAAKVGQYQNIILAHGAGNLRVHDRIDVEVTSPQLAVDGQGPSRRFIDRPATHNFMVSNLGTADATNLELVARLPRGLRFVETNNQGQYDPSTNAVYWSLAALGPGKTGRVEMTTTPVETGPQRIDFEVTADMNQFQSAQHSVVVEELVELFFDVDDVADPIEVGSETTYQVHLENQGSKSATNVQLQVDFPQAIRPTAVEGVTDFEIRGQSVLLAPIPRLDPRQRVDFSIRADGLAEGDHRVVIRMRSADRQVDVSKEESTKVYADR